LLFPDEGTVFVTVAEGAETRVVVAEVEVGKMVEAAVDVVAGLVVLVVAVMVLEDVKTVLVVDFVLVVVPVTVVDEIVVVNDFAVVEGTAVELLDFVVVLESVRWEVEAEITPRGTKICHSESDQEPLSSALPLIFDLPAYGPTASTWHGTMAFIDLGSAIHCISAKTLIPIFQSSIVVACILTTSQTRYDCHVIAVFLNRQ